jgi:hypothetical protein
LPLFDGIFENGRAAPLAGRRKWVNGIVEAYRG